jgi:polyisoprenoid-binding protein YceI
MGLTRYTFDSARSCLWISGRSSLHPINSETRGITGWFEAALSADGSLDLDRPVSGELELAVERLTSGNQLYDRELRRRIDAAHFPTIAGRVTAVALDGAPPDYVVTGEIAFHGKTRTFTHEMRIEVHDHGIVLTGEDVFDIREFGMKPPSMLMVRVYPEITVRVELLGSPASRSGATS